MNPTVILVGADKGGVGKTTVSRVLLDHLGSLKITARAFDTEHPRGTLKRFHPKVTEIVDVTSSSDQMKILDTLSNAAPSVSIIDVRAGQLSLTLAMLEEVGFLEAVAAGEFNFVLFHVIGPSIASLDEIAEIAPYASEANYFLVKNFINDTTFFEWDPQTSAAYFKKIKRVGDITIPKLNELAYEQVELAGVPFASFVNNKNASGGSANYSFVLRGYVRTWLRNISAEFDRVGLVHAMGATPTKRAR